MRRRDFVAGGMAMAGFAMSGEGSAAAPPRDFYLLRRYALQTGPQSALVQAYFEHALMPALNRLGSRPVGAFKLDIGPETPAFYLLVPASSIELLATLDQRLGDDAEFLKSASAYWAAPASAPAFARIDSSLLSAFTGWPRLTAPKDTRRIFQLRTYESASNDAHVRKIKMFNDAEIAIFVRSGLAPVIFGDTLLGPRTPSLTYMLTFPDVTELNVRWAAFAADPEWKEISRRPGNTDPEIVSNISNLYLSPLRCSQI